MVFSVRDKLCLVLDNILWSDKIIFTLVLLNLMSNKDFYLIEQLIVFSSFSEEGFNVKDRKMDMSTVLKVCTYNVYNYICEILMWNFNIKGNSVNNSRILYGLYACSYDKAKKIFLNMSLREKMSKVTTSTWWLGLLIRLKCFLNFHMWGRRCSLGMTPWAVMKFWSKKRLRNCNKLINQWNFHVLIFVGIWKGIFQWKQPVLSNAPSDVHPVWR